MLFWPLRVVWNLVMLVPLMMFASVYIPYQLWVGRGRKMNFSRSHAKELGLLVSEEPEVEDSEPKDEKI